MGIALIVMLPISVVIAATMRSTLGPSIWFQIHRTLGVSQHKLLEASTSQPISSADLLLTVQLLGLQLLARINFLQRHVWPFGASQSEIQNLPQTWAELCISHAEATGQASHLVHMQVLAFLAVVPGAVLGIILWRQLVETSLLTAHASVGLIVLGFTVLQVLALAWRARPCTKLRCHP